MITLVIAFTFHEFSHAWVANAFGDPTPRMNGRLTLNPIAHLDILGTLLLITAGFGWAKPVPVNPYELNRRSPAALMWVSLAGPFSNLILAILGAIPLRMGWVQYTYASGGFLPSLGEFFVEFIVINLTLMLFNLIPIAPLDGEKVLEYFLPARWADKLAVIQPYGPFILLAVAFVGPMLGVNILSAILTPPMNAMLGLLLGV
jgi:Zn-dependent protease